MIKHISRWWLLVIAALLEVGQANGVAFAQGDEVRPAPQTFQKLLSTDRSAPSQVDIWEDEFVGYGGVATLAAYAAYCLSESDVNVGACPTAEDSRDPTPVMIRFREKRTNLVVDVIAEGRRNLFYLNQPEMSSGIADSRRTYLPQITTRFNLYIPANEIAKFPTGGVWEGVIHFRVVRDSRKEGEIGGELEEVPWIVNVTIKVTDESNIQVYIPEFGSGPPRVDLALRGHPHAGGPGVSMSGHRVIDACLYDGYNSQSNLFEITITDLGSPGDTFHVTHDSALIPGDLSERIDYQIFAPDPVTGADTEFISGKTQTFHGVNTAGWRMVRLPFSPLPVACTPWPITLETPKFNSSEKHSGAYLGTLQLEFKPSTSSP